MEIRACKNAQEKIKFGTFRFYPTFDKSYLNVFPHKKCKKQTFVLQSVLG